MIQELCTKGKEKKIDFCRQKWSLHNTIFHWSLIWSVSLSDIISLFNPVPFLKMLPSHKDQSWSSFFGVLKGQLCTPMKLPDAEPDPAALLLSLKEEEHSLVYHSFILHSCLFCFFKLHTFSGCFPFKRLQNKCWSLQCCKTKSNGGLTFAHYCKMLNPNAKTQS